MAHNKQPLLVALRCSSEYDHEYIVRNPSTTTLDTTPLMSEHDVNTDRVRRASVPRFFAYTADTAVARQRFGVIRS